MSGDLLFAAPSRYEGDDAFYMNRDVVRFVQHQEREGTCLRLAGSGWNAVVIGIYSDEVADGTATAKRVVRPVSESHAAGRPS